MSKDKHEILSNIYEILRIIGVPDFIRRFDIKMQQKKESYRFNPSCEYGGGGEDGEGSCGAKQTVESFKQIYVCAVN